MLATKFGNERLPKVTRMGINGSPDHVRRACDASQERLGVEHSDLNSLRMRLDTLRGLGGSRHLSLQSGIPPFPGRKLCLNQPRGPSA